MNSITTPVGAAAPRVSGSRAAGMAQRHAWLVCAALVALWLAATAWLRPLAIPDEGRYSGVAWEMLRSGDWLVPTLNGHPFFHKPPLFYWITAASMDFFGVGVWSARVASLLAATAAATGLFAFVRRWADRRLARATVLVAVTMPLFYGAAQYANLDMLVAGCIAAAILLAAHASLSMESGRPYRSALGLAFVSVACGVMAKGLIGAVIPTLVLLGWGLATGRARRITRLLLWVPGWLVFLALTAPWFIAMQQRFPDFGHYFFVVQHLQRFTSVGFNSPQPPWFYLAVLSAATLPWSPWLLAMLSARFWRRREHGDLRALMLVWLAVVIGFFSVPDSKLVGYIVPALPALAFLVADAIGFMRAQTATPAAASLRFSWPRMARTTLAVAATGCVAIATAAHFYQPKSLATLAERLQAGRASGETVVFLGNYYYDVPLHARLEAPVFVADAWAAADLAKDSWRRELSDAERFAPGAPRRRLIGYDELGRLLCGRGPTWIVGPWPSAARTPWLASQDPVYREGDVALWRVPPRRLPRSAAGACAGAR